MEGTQKIFTYEEALATFPCVRDATEAAVKRVEALASQLGSTEELAEGHQEYEDAYQEIVHEWVDEVTAVGCEVKGLWLVDWDSGDGYYCWRYPEASVCHFHTYEEGFQGRVPVN